MTAGACAANAATNGRRSRPANTSMFGTVAAVVCVFAADPCPGQCLTTPITPARERPAFHAVTASATRAGSAEKLRCSDAM